MPNAKYGAGPTMSTTSSQSHNPIGIALLSTGPKSSIRPFNQRHPSTMHFLSPIAKIDLRLAASPKCLLWARGRRILHHRRTSPFLHYSNQLIDTVHIAPTERIAPLGNPRQTGADIWSRNRGDPTQLPQLALTQLGIAHRQGVLPASPEPRGCGKGFQMLRKVLLGRRRREIPLPGQFHAHVHRGPFRTCNFPDHFPEKRRAFNNKSGSPRAEI